MSDPSKSQVKKAGSILRKHMRGETIDQAQVFRAMEIVTAFRAVHAAPLVTANNGLRSMLRTEECPVEVTQRLKRMNTILDKLRREPSSPSPACRTSEGCGRSWTTSTRYVALKNG